MQEWTKICHFEEFLHHLVKIPYSRNQMLSIKLNNVIMDVTCQSESLCLCYYYIIVIFFMFGL